MTTIPKNIGKYDVISELGRGATSVASFSLRAREGAPVAMPLRWEELGRIKGGNAYDLASASRRMKRLRSHPWGEYARIRQNLAKVGEKLAGGN